MALTSTLLLCGCTAENPARAASSLTLAEPEVTGPDPVEITFADDSRAVAQVSVPTGDQLISVPPGALQVDRHGKLMRAWKSTSQLKVAVVEDNLTARLAAGTPRPVTMAVSSDDELVQSVEWTTVRNRARLAVEPTPFARQAGDGAAEVLWQEVIDRQPNADRPGMADQLRCHLALAPDKREYHLEPWRPSVGYPATVAALCNPGPDSLLG